MHFSVYSRSQMTQGGKFLVRFRFSASQRIRNTVAEPRQRCCVGVVVFPMAYVGCGCAARGGVASRGCMAGRRHRADPD